MPGLLDDISPRMHPLELQQRLRTLAAEPLPIPGRGQTALRHQRILEVAAEDVSLAKLAEAHWDALAILAEAGRSPVPGALYAVWASEVPNQPLVFENGRLSGTKAFSSGGGIVDRALVTVGPPDHQLLDIDVRLGPAVQLDLSRWQPEAFRLTQTGSVSFRALPVAEGAIIGHPGFYVGRPGFWHGACGPAACWAGGAAGLLAYADASRRSDSHTLAHLAAIHANVWAMRSLLRVAGDEIDAAPEDIRAAQQRALTLRHLIEQLATDTLRRFGRAYGPFPLAMDPDTARRYHETEIFLRQCHAERDLEGLAGVLRSAG